MLPGGCLRDRGKLDEDGPKLNSLFGVPVPISEAVDDGCPKSKVAMSQGTPILWKKNKLIAYLLVKGIFFFPCYTGFDWLFICDL